MIHSRLNPRGLAATAARGQEQTMRRQAPPGDEGLRPDLEESLGEPVVLESGQPSAAPQIQPKTALQTAVLVGLGGVTLAGVFLGGGGASPDQLTESAVDSIIDQARDGTAWDETGAITAVTETGIRNRAQLEVVEQTARHARSQDWAGANRVVDATLRNPELDDLHVDTVTGVLNYLSPGDNLDEGEVLVNVLSSLRLSESHNDFVGLVTRHAHNNPEFQGGSELIESGLSNRSFNRHNLELTEQLLDVDQDLPHFDQARALVAVAEASGLTEQQQDLIQLTIRQAQRQPDWTGANDFLETVLESTVSDQEVDLVSTFLRGSSLESQGVTSMARELFRSSPLEGPKLSLVEKLGESLADHDWNPSRVLTYLLSRPNLTEARAELAEAVLDGLDTSDGFQTSTALLTIFEADWIQEGPQTKAMAAVIDHATGQDWEHGNEILKILASQSFMTESQASQVIRALESEGLDQVGAVRALVQPEGDQLEEWMGDLAQARAEFSLQGRSAPTPYHQGLAELLGRQSVATADTEGGAEPLLEAAWANPGLNEHHLEAVEALLTLDQPDVRLELATTVLSIPDLSRAQLDLVEALVEHWDSAPGEIGTITMKALANPDFDSLHLEVAEKMLELARTGDEFLSTQAMNELAEASALNREQKDFLLAVVERAGSDSSWHGNPVFTAALTAGQGPFDGALSLLAGPRSDAVLPLVLEGVSGDQLDFLTTLANDAGTLHSTLYGIASDVVVNPDWSRDHTVLARSLWEKGRTGDQFLTTQALFDLAQVSQISPARGELLEAIAVRAESDRDWRGNEAFRAALREDLSETRLGQARELVEVKGSDELLPLYLKTDNPSPAQVEMVQLLVETWPGDSAAIGERVFANSDFDTAHLEVGRQALARGQTGDEFSTFEALTELAEAGPLNSQQQDALLQIVERAAQDLSWNGNPAFTAALR